MSEHATPSEHVVPPPGKAESPLILVVDDDHAARALMRQTLEKSGFRVVEGANGEEGVDAFETHLPDLVITDVIMPRLDGYDTCARIRQLPGGASVPVIIITSLDDVASIERAYEAGATDFIIKPIKWAILHHRVRHMLRANRMADHLRKSEARLAHAQRISHVGHWEWDTATGLVTWSDEIFQIFGVAPTQFGDRYGAVLEYTHPEDRGILERAVEDATRSRSPFSMDHRITRPDGEIRVIHQEAEWVENPDRTSRMVGIIQDITERHTAQEQIRYLALHDTLTGLPNHVLFKDHLQQALARSERRKNSAAVMFLGLDRFNRINDTLGHSVGDQLLKACANRLKFCLDNREDDGADSGRLDTLVSRFAGDEFTILLADVSRVDEVVKVVQRISSALALPFVVDGHEIYLTSSIGISLYPFDGDNADRLLKNADSALVHAKRQGKNTFQFFAASMNANTTERLSLESKLRKAVENNELLLYYQPKVDARSGSIIGMEALVRWQHPELGMVSPDAFIPLAEESGLIVSIGEWVLREACRQNKEWQEQGVAYLRIAVNLSGRQFDDRLIKMVEQALGDSRIDPRYIDLEITESAIMHDPDRAIVLLQALKAMGVRLSIDDFGTGYSSLNYLKRFPLDALKIDRSFVTDVTTNPDDAVIARTIISMARTLKLSVVAEGVETREQAAFLLANGCHEMQGYLFSPPVSAKAFERLIHEASTAAPARR